VCPISETLQRQICRSRARGPRTERRTERSPADSAGNGRSVRV